MSLVVRDETSESENPLTRSKPESESSLYLILSGINVNKICSNGMTLIGAAAQTGNLLVLKSLIEYHNCLAVNLDIQNKNTTTKPLFLQLDSEIQKRNVGYFVVCRDLEENEFGDGPTPDGMEALEWDMEVNTTEEDPVEDQEVNLYRWYANILNRTSIILESPEYDIGRLDRHGQNVLHYAVNSRNLEMVEYLINSFSKDLHVNQTDACGFSPLHMAAANGDVDLIKWMLKKGALVNLLGGRLRQSPLHVASRGGHVAAMHLLIDAGADVNLVDVDERSALTSAARMGCEEAVRMLVNAGARVNHEEMGGITALQLGVWGSKLGIVRILLENGARIIHSHRLLHIAVTNNNLDCVQALVSGGGIINVRDEQGLTPLMMACSRKNIPMARFLLNNGAEVNAASHIDGKTALHICVQDVREAKSANHIIELLVNYGADMNATSYQGTVLFYSIILENRTASAALIRHGADVNLRDERAYVDNLSLAKRHGDLELLKLLVFGGFRLSEMSADIKTLRTKPQDPAYDFLVNVKTNPLNLRELCRISIRNCIGPRSLISKIKVLPLPTFVQQYLALEIL